MIWTISEMIRRKAQKVLFVAYSIAYHLCSFHLPITLRSFWPLNLGCHQKEQNVIPYTVNALCNLNFYEPDS